MSKRFGARLLFLAFFAWLVAPVCAAAAVLVVDHAEVTTELQGRASDPVRGRLPLHWDQRHGAVDGQARIVMQVPVSDTAVPLGLYIPRIGNNFVIKVNGQALAHFGTLPANRFDDSAMEPQYFVVPAHWLAPKTTLEITLGVLGGRAGGLSRVTVGPEGEVYPIYRTAHFWQVGGARAVTAVSAVLGLLALLLWLRQRDRAYLYYGLGELLWSVQTLRVLVAEAPLPWPWWGVIPLAAFNAAPPLLCKFALTVMGRDQGRVARMMDVMVLLAVPVALLTMLGGVPWLGPAWQGLIVLTSIVVACVVVSGAARSDVWEKRLLGAAIALVVVGALRDILVIRLSPDTYAMVPWTRFSWVGFGIALAWIIAERLRKASVALATMNATLTEQLAQRNAELTVAFERERGNEKERGAVEERQRLMRDLHDGLGSQLVGALRVSQQASTSRQEVTSQLREAIDQLKVTVDAMQQSDGDIATALGTVRYRLTPRLQAAGIELDWDVAAHLPVFADWGPRQSYQLQMILFEAFANMAVHSGATAASLRARAVKGAQGAAVEVDIRDNGKGFEPKPATSRAGKGLSNMRTRATALGADLRIVSSPGETQIVIVLPLSSAVVPA